MGWENKMIVHKPVITEEKNEICVSAKVDTKNHNIKLPDVLWFKFPKGYKEYVTDRSDGFAAALLPIAMVLGEDIEIKGTVSPHLAFGMREYQRITSVWWPDLLRSIHVTFENLKSLEEKKATGKVGCAFSGGVDSFYTLWSHLPRNEAIEKYRISHCLMIKRFNLLEDKINFDTIQKIYEPMMKRLDLQLLVCDSNIIIEFIGPIEKIFLEKPLGELFTPIHGTTITAFVLMLGRFFSDFYIGSAYKFTYSQPDGSNPLLVHLLSTEETEMIGDGSHLTRVEKTATLSNWPETYLKLHVCFKATADEKKDTILNCCKCEKCLRTMTSLYLLHKLPQYASFPSPLTGKNIRKIYYSHSGKYHFAQEIIEYAIKTGRKSIALNIRVAVFLNRMTNPIHHLNHKLTKQSKTYSTLMDLIKKMLSIRVTSKDNR
jgi:hypothetical protein